AADEHAARAEINREGAGNGNGCDEAKGTRNGDRKCTSHLMVDPRSTDVAAQVAAGPTKEHGRSQRSIRVIDRRRIGRQLGGHCGQRPHYAYRNGVAESIPDAHSPPRRVNALHLAATVTFKSIWVRKITVAVA